MANKCHATCGMRSWRRIGGFAQHLLLKPHEILCTMTYERNILMH